jgi:predicted small secreted protein
MRLFFALMIALFVLTGCNTVHGFGKDVHEVGDKIGDAFKK